MDTIETLETIAQSQAKRWASPEDVLVEMGTFAAGTLAAATGDYIALGGFDGIRERVRMGVAVLKEKYQHIKDTLNDEEKMKPVRDEALGILMAQTAALTLTGDVTTTVALLPHYAPTGFRAIPRQIGAAFDYLSALAHEREDAARRS